MNPLAPVGRGVPVWWWVAPLVLGAHLLLFWAVSGRPALPLAAPRLPPVAVPGPTPADFAVRETVERDPRTGEVTVGREFSVPARLATPPTPRP